MKQKDELHPFAKNPLSDLYRYFTNQRHVIVRVDDEISTG